MGVTGTNSKKEKEDMATIRPKSPRPVAIKGEKDESIWDKIGTLGRKKRIKEGMYSLFTEINVLLLLLYLVMSKNEQ